MIFEQGIAKCSNILRYLAFYRLYGLEQMIYIFFTASFPFLIAL